jgi:hypothetical protein
MFASLVRVYVATVESNRGVPRSGRGYTDGPRLCFGRAVSNMRADERLVERGHPGNISWAIYVP